MCDIEPNTACLLEGNLHNLAVDNKVITINNGKIKT